MGRQTDGFFTPIILFPAVLLSHSCSADPENYSSGSEDRPPGMFLVTEPSKVFSKLLVHSYGGDPGVRRFFYGSENSFCN